MAFSSSGLYVHTFQEALRATAITGTGGLDFRLGTWKIALHDNTLTQGTAPINYSAATVVWATTGQVTGTGWATGGPTITTATGGSATLGEGTAGSLRYDAGDVSVASTTLTGIRGCIIYADNITAPADLVDAMAVAITFGQDYATSAGTFAITWSATGIAEIDLTP